jgi:hypothetical protein
MLLTYLMLFVALMLSAVAAFYSIIGLTAIFAAAVWPIVIMGTILEAAKLVVTVWLHEYWRDVKLTMKIYLVPAVFTLMVITSMGIFGFLSKAHLDQTVPTGDVQAQVALIDEKINNERETIASARTLLGQLDKAVTDIGSAPDREVNGRVISSAERALQVRRQQARDRAALTKTIEESQARIVTLQEQKAPFAKELRKVEAEVGPIKYIAALIYGDNPDANLLEKAVRWVIIILVVVFDPLAIMMLLAATESYRWERNKPAQQAVEEQHHDPKDNDQVTASNRSEPDDSGVATTVTPPVSPLQQETMSPAPVKIVDYQILDDHNEPDYFDPSDRLVEKPEIFDIDEDNNLPDVIRQCMRLWKHDHPGMTLKEQRRQLAAGLLDHEPWLDYLDDPRILRECAFGDRLPDSAHKGDMFVMTSVIPTGLYKHNGEKWIGIDKTLTDQYAYNDAYIDYLIQQVGTGVYDPDLLSDAERAQIATRLRKEI